MEKILLEFGHRLKELRESRNLRQKEMADIMGITDRHYQRFEYGKVNVSATTLSFFADYFGVTTDYLLGRSEEKRD